MKKRFRPTLQQMIRMTLNCVIPTESNVIQTIHCNVDLICFFSIFLTCLFVFIVMYAYFIDILQGSVETNSPCHGMCNNHIIVNCLQSALVKNKSFENRSIIGEDMDKSKVARFSCLTLCVYSSRRSQVKDRARSCVKNVLLRYLQSGLNCHILRVKYVLKLL